MSLVLVLTRPSSSTVFGKPLIEQAVIRQKLAHMFAKIEAVQTFLEHISRSSRPSHSVTHTHSRADGAFVVLSSLPDEPHDLRSTSRGSRWSYRCSQGELSWLGGEPSVRGMNRDEHSY